jgi:hypothetical protein
MTARQQRRLEQKLARKAAKRAVKTEAIPAVTPTEPEVGRALLSARNALVPQVQRSISEAKLVVNRANAQLSTGATTQAGKAIVSQNATKHGLTGKFKVLACESQSEFDELLAGFLRSEAPVGDDEIEMVHQMAEALWLSRRCVRLQNNCFAALEFGRSEEQRAVHKSLALYMRYQTTHDRTFFRYLTELRKRRNERARAQRGFVSQKLKEAADRRRHELHQARQALQNARLEGQEIRNRLAAAKAEALELRNLAGASMPDSRAGFAGHAKAVAGHI